MKDFIAKREGKYMGSTPPRQAGSATTNST